MSLNPKDLPDGGAALCLYQCEQCHSQEEIPAEVLDMTQRRQENSGMKLPIWSLSKALLALIAIAAASPATADGWLNYFYDYNIQGHASAAATLRTGTAFPVTDTPMWAVAWIAPPSGNVSYTRLPVTFLGSASWDQTVLQTAGSIELKDGNSSTATTVPNLDTASPVCISQGGRIVTDTDNTANPPITTQRQTLTRNVYVFWMAQNGAISQLMCAKVTDGVQENTISGFGGGTYVTHVLQTGLVQGATTLGASPTPDGAGFVTVTVKPSKTTATVTYWTWNPAVDTYNVTQAFQQDISLPAGLTAQYNGNITCAVTRNFDRMARWYPYRLTIALNPDVAGQFVRVRDYRFNNKMKPSFFSRYLLTPVPRDDTWHTIGNATAITFNNIDTHSTNIQVTPDGRPLVAVPEAAGVRIYGRTGFDPQTQAVQWQAPGAGELIPTNWIPAFIYRPRFPASTPADNTDVKVNVARDMIASQTFGYPSLNVYEITTNQKAHRMPLPPAQGSLATVLGIVDGPPPIPNENFGVALPTDPRPWDFATSDVAFNWTRTASSATESEYQSSLTVGATASAGFSFFGFGADVEVSGEVAWNHGNSYSRKVGDTVESFAKFANATTTDENGKIIVQPLGSLYCEFQQFRGYTYEYLDANDNVIPGAQVYSQVWPDGAPTIQVLDYWMNPNGRQPGHLESYIVDAATRNALRAQNTVDFSGLASSGDPAGNGGDHLYFGYTDQNTVGDTWDHFVSDESKNTEGIKIGEALKVSAHADFAFGNVSTSVSVAHDDEVTRTRTTAHDTSAGVVSEASVITDRGVPNTYYHESFETFLLKDDNHYLQELLSDDPNGIGLVTSTWPPIGSTMRQDNEIIKSQLIRTSAPWKVTYILADAPLKTHSLTTMAKEPGAPTLDSKLVDKLARYGVNTTGLADLVIKRRAQISGTTPKVLTNRPWFEVTRELEQRAQRLDASIRRYFPDTSKFNAALRNLTDSDVEALRNYQSASDQYATAKYLREHPLKYPVYTPSSMMSRPVTRNVINHFNELPPPG